MIETIGELIAELNKLPAEASLLILNEEGTDYVPIQVIDYTGDGDYVLEPDDNF